LRTNVGKDAMGTARMARRPSRPPPRRPVAETCFASSLVLIIVLPIGCRRD
jgi:hypothetical protein